MILKYNCFLRLAFLLSIGSLTYFTSCVSIASFQSARTLEKGKFSTTAGLGYNNQAEESYIDIGLRAGIADSLDMGLRLNATSFGSVLVMLDAKKQLKSKSENYANAIGYGISPVFDDQEGIAFHVPMYFSYHSDNDLFTLYSNPRIYYYLDFLKEDGFNNSGLGFGNSLGIKFGRKFSVMPEWTLLIGSYRDEIEVNNLLGVGLGWNVK